MRAKRPQSDNPEHDTFGQPCAGSRWFNQKPATIRKEVRTYLETWPCPIAGCTGEMEDDGFRWSVSPPGIHHTCTVCDFTAAIRGESYPRTVTEPI